MPINIDDAQEKVKKASTFFDTVNAFIKRHPIWAIIILIIILSELGYLGFLASSEEEEVDTKEHYEEGCDEKVDMNYQLEFPKW